VTWSKPELFPAETRLFLDKLRILIPDFDTYYADEVHTVMTKIALQEAIVAWKRGDAGFARNILRPFRRESRSAMLISLWALFLPFKTFELANRVRVGLTS